jgi:aconitate hydratase
MAAAGRPFFVRMPQVWGVRLSAALRPWVSAKDVILELLRRYGVKGAVGCVLEYHGPGLESLSAMDRHVLANMGTELGATSSVFPSDIRVCEYLRAQGREEDWSELVADADASYERYEEVDLSTIEPMIALPSSPDNVRRVSEVAGEKIYQAYIGSSANPGYRDLAVAAAMVDGRQVHPEVSFDVNPASRQVLATLIRDGALGRLVAAGARVHQAGCNGCIGMGQAPATDRISLRTVPRNFPGRSGTREDKVCLVSPETAAAGALTGVITDPRTLNLEYPSVTEPDDPVRIPGLIEEPPPPEEAREVPLVRGPNIVALPPLEPFPDEIEVAVLLKLADNVSTDEILPGGSRVLPWRSNIPAISRFTFIDIDATYATRATEVRDRGGHAIVAGENYGQGSSREHAAFAPRFLGLRVVLARSFARIHWQNLTSYGVLPLTLERGEDYDRLEPGGRLSLRRLHRQLRGGSTVRVERADGSGSFETTHHLSPRQLDVLLAGGLINWMRLVGRHEPLPSATR